MRKPEFLVNTDKIFGVPMGRLFVPHFLLINMNYRICTKQLMSTKKLITEVQNSYGFLLQFLSISV